MLINDFFIYTFVRRLDVLDEQTKEAIVIDEITPIEPESPNKPRKKEEQQKPTRSTQYETKVVSIVILQINRVLLAICILSFAAIITYPLINPKVTLPEVIPNTFALTVGYFGSALVTFLEKNSKSRK